MSAIDLAATAIRNLKEGQTLQDLPTAERAKLLGAYLAECPEDFGEVYQGISTANFVDAFRSMAEGDTDQFGFILSAAMANTPSGSDFIGWLENKARDRMIPFAGEEAENAAANAADSRYTDQKENAA